MTQTTDLIATLSAGLVLALVLGVLASRLRQPPLVGYLLAGVVVGPHTPGFVADQSLAPQLANVGMLLLMFGVGLSFSPRDLVAVRGIVVPGTVLHTTLATLMGAGLGLALGWSVAGSLLFGFALSVTSTVVLLKWLQDRHLAESARGKIAVGWLVLEDLVTVLALVLVPVLVGLGAIESMRGPLAVLIGDLVGIPPDFRLVVVLTVTKVAVFIALMLVVGRRLVPWLLHAIAHTGSRELFRLAVLATALGIAFGASELFGVSIALGAFLAGMVLAESPLATRAAQESLPLRDAFAVLFFVAVGMLFDPAAVVADPLPLLAVVAVIVLGRVLITFGLVVAFGHPVATALFLATSRAQIGEFSFILAEVGLGLGLLPPEAQDLIIGGALISIVLNPFVVYLGERATPALERRIPGEAPAPSGAAPEGAASPSAETRPGAETVSAVRAGAAETPAARVADSSAQAAAGPAPTEQRDHTVLVGFGRVGSVIGEALDKAGVRYLVIEAGDASVGDIRERGIEAFAGNAANPAVLALGNPGAARVLVIAIPDAFEAGQIAEQARRANPALRIVARAHSDDEADHLATRGADVVVMAEREIARGILDRLGLELPAGTAAVPDGDAGEADAPSVGSAERQGDV